MFLNTKNSSITCQRFLKIWRDSSNLRTRIHSGARFVAMREFEKRVFDGVSEKQRNDLRAALDRISANLS